MTGTIIPERLEKLNDITLTHGAHTSPDDGMCVMEAAAWIAGEEWTDHPACVSPILAALCRLLNDAWDDEGRQRLKPFAARAIGTARDGQDEARSYMALDWLVRTHAPAWLDLAGLREEATELRGHRRIADQTAATAAHGSIKAARQSASAAWAAVRAAARAAAGDALAPTVRHLQASVLGLLDRMIDPRASVASRTEEEATR